VREPTVGSNEKSRTRRWVSSGTDASSRVVSVDGSTVTACAGSPPAHCAASTLWQYLSSPADTLGAVVAVQVDVAQAFQIFSVMEVSDGIDLSVTLQAFKDKFAEDNKKTCKGISAGAINVLCRGKKLTNPDKELEKQGVKPGNKLMVTNCNAILKDNIGHALRSMGYAVTETQMESFTEEAEGGADLGMMQKFISEIEAEPIGQQAISDMEEVLAKEGHYKTPVIEKIFKALDETNLSAAELEMIMKAADPSGSGQIPKEFFAQMI
jgi:Ca2+-binding EF-hand superfamily protein